MGCPHCKLTLGWGPAPEYPEGTKWFRHVEPRFRCKHCGKYVVLKKNDKYWRFGLIFLFVALCLFWFQKEFEFFMPVMIVVLAGFIYTVIGAASSSRFEKDEET